MPKEPPVTKTNVVRVVTNIQLSGTGIQAEYAELTFEGEVEVKKLGQIRFSVDRNNRFRTG